jgi:hypothetical protein
LWPLWLEVWTAFLREDAKGHEGDLHISLSRGMRTCRRVHPLDAEVRAVMQLVGTPFDVLAWIAQLQPQRLDRY